MPSPAQIRELRVSRLVAIARELLERGVPFHLLFGKLWTLATSLWPMVSDSTNRTYVVCAMRAVLSRPKTEPVFPEVVGEIAPLEGA